MLADNAALPPKLQRLLESARNLGDPGVAGGRQTYPDYSGIAAPAHQNVEKDRVRLMVSPWVPIPCRALGPANKLKLLWRHLSDLMRLRSVLHHLCRRRLLLSYDFHVHWQVEVDTLIQRKK